VLIQEGLDAAYEHKTVKQFLIDLARARLAEMERKGMGMRVLKYHMSVSVVFFLALVSSMVTGCQKWKTPAQMDGGQTGVSETRLPSGPSVKGVAPVESHELTGSVFHVTDSNFSADVLNEKMPVLVDCWAVWAGPSQMIAPILIEIAEAYAGRLKVVALNIDESPQTTQKYEVKGIPYLMLFAQGEVIAKWTGALSKGQLEAWLDKNLKK